MCWGLQGGAIGLAVWPAIGRSGLALLGNCKCCGINGGCTLVPIVGRLLTAALRNLPPRHLATSDLSRTREGSVEHTSFILMLSVCLYRWSLSQLCPNGLCSTHAD